MERLSKLLTGWVQLLRAHRARAEELRRNHRPRTLWSPCTDPCCGSGRAPSDKTVLCRHTIRRNRPNPRFSRDILVPTTGVWESCSLQGQCPPGAHALRARNTTKYIAGITSVQALPSLSSGAPTGSAPDGLPDIVIRKPLGHLPSPEDGPRTPTWPVTGLRNAPFGAVLRALPHCWRSFKHRRTFAAMLRAAAQRSNTDG